MKNNKATLYSRARYSVSYLFNKASIVIKEMPVAFWATIALIAVSDVVN